ncbi:MAG: TetR/AcrR family transcriptional regulator [Phycisphaeraceae bacterium]|nr:TetR/AcrR family transcriptional regulator [Phycisphaeraceae bacterium]
MAALTTRERLIDEAVDLFYQRGFQAVGLDQILHRVGITKTAFYKHFESKDDLIVAVLHKRDGDDLAEMVKCMDELGGRDPRKRLLALFEVLDRMLRDPGFRGCLFMNAATEFPLQNDPIHRAAAAHGDHIAEIVHKCITDLGLADPAKLTRQIMLIFGGAIAARHVGGELDAAESARSMTEAILDRALAKSAG